MIIKNDILKKLKSAFDLNEYEVKIWVALLSRGSATAGELSDISNVPRSRTYDILESLEKKGFIIMKVGRPIKYIAVSPNDIVGRVKKDIEIRTQETLDNLEKVKETDSFKEIILLHKQGILGVDPSEVSGAFKGRTAIYTHLNDLFLNAKKEVIIVGTDNDFIRKIKHFKNNFNKLKQKDVKIRFYAPFEAEEAKNAAEEAKNYINSKRFDLRGRFVIVDNEDVVFMVNDDKNTDQNSEVGIWVKTGFFANSLKQMIDIYSRE
jgi:sugar-specific transcriptional regulator TrmB